MSECKYKGENRKCYYPGLIDPDFGPDWCVEGPCHLIEPIKEKKAAENEARLVLEEITTE